MRIICPKCTAAYDIPTKAIPLDGREVQCSSCTHAWYQLPLSPSESAPPLSLQTQKTSAESDDKTPFDALKPLEGGLTPIHMQEKEAERISEQIERLRGALSAEPRLPHVRNSSDRPTTPEPDEPEETPWVKDDGPALPPQRKIDPKVLEVLREEAVRETRARKSEPAPILNPQPDLGLGEPPKRAARKSEGIREKLARLQAAEKGIEHPAPWVRREQEKPVKKTTPPGTGPEASATPDAPKQPDPKPTAKVEPKPSSAAPSSQQPAQRSVLVRPKSRGGLPVALSSRELALIAEKEERVGFRWGFGATAGLCCLALGLYLAAAPLARALPNEQRILELVVEKGAIVQDKLATGVRAALAALGATTPNED